MNLQWTVDFLKLGWPFSVGLAIALWAYLAVDHLAQFEGAPADCLRPIVFLAAFVATGLSFAPTIATLAMKARQALSRRRERMLGFENLVALDDLEKKQLKWILKNGSQRFTAHSAGTLVVKHIIRHLEDDPFSGVFIVNDRIWTERRRLLEEELRNVDDSTGFPTPGSFY